MTDYQSAEVALVLEDLFKSQAKARQGARTDLQGAANIPQNSAGSGETRDTIAQVAGVSHGTIDKVKARMLAGVKVDPTQNSAGGGETRAAIAQTAGVSHNTIDKVKNIQRDAIAEVRLCEHCEHGELAFRAIPLGENSASLGLSPGRLDRGSASTKNTPCFSEVLTWRLQTQNLEPPTST